MWILSTLFIRVFVQHSPDWLKYRHCTIVKVFSIVVPSCSKWAVDINGQNDLFSLVEIIYISCGKHHSIVDNLPFISLTVQTVSTVPVAQVAAQPYTAPPTYPPAATAQYHTRPPPPTPATYHHPVPAAAVANQYYQQTAAPAAIPYQAPVTAPPVVQYQVPSAPPVIPYQQAPAAQTDTVSSQIRSALIDATVGQIVDNSVSIE